MTKLILTLCLLASLACGQSVDGYLLLYPASATNYQDAFGAAISNVLRDTGYVQIKQLPVCTNKSGMFGFYLFPGAEGFRHFRADQSSEPGKLFPNSMAWRCWTLTNSVCAAAGIPGNVATQFWAAYCTSPIDATNQLRIKGWTCTTNRP